MKRVIFITGTDTGVGKTVLTALLLLHLRQSGVNALALKPFCSGGREDVDLLQSLQPGQLSDKQVTPYFFPEPVAPVAATSRKTRRLSSEEILSKINEIKACADVLLIEGAGGVMVPLCSNLFLADVIASLECEVFLVSRNQLGTLNHTILSVEALEKRGVKRIKIILMEALKKDISAKSNATILRDIFPRYDILSIPFSSKKPNKNGLLVAFSKKIKKTLATLILDN